MTTGLAYTEIYTDKNSAVWGLRRANGMAPIPPDYEGATNIFDFLVAQTKQGEHGKAFCLQDRQFRRAGLDHQARQRHDAVRSALRADLGADGRGGRRALSRRSHRHRERRRRSLDDACAISPASARPSAISAASTAARSCRRRWSRTSRVAATPKNSSRPATPRCPARPTAINGGSRTMRTAPIMARGVHGQGIYIDPKAEMVIARYASHPVAGNAANDPVTLPAYMALAKELMAGG